MSDVKTFGTTSLALRMRLWLRQSQDVVRAQCHVMSCHVMFNLEVLNNRGQRRKQLPSQLCAFRYPTVNVWYGRRAYLWRESDGSAI